MKLGLREFVEVLVVADLDRQVREIGGVVERVLAEHGMAEPPKKPPGKVRVPKEEGVAAGV